MSDRTYTAAEYRHDETRRPHCQRIECSRSRVEPSRSRRSKAGPPEAESRRAQHHPDPPSCCSNRCSSNGCTHAVDPCQQPDPPPNHHPQRGPHPPLYLPVPVFFGVLCGWVLGPPASLRSLGYRLALRARCYQGILGWFGCVDTSFSAFRFTAGRTPFPPLGGPTPYQVPDLSMSTRFYSQLQRHPPTYSRGRFLLITHLEAGVC